MTNHKSNPNNPSSFAVPHAAIKALLDARADAVTIGAYLKLAAHTEGTGQFSSASVTAIQNAVGGGKDRFNRKRAADAIAKLCTIRAPIQAAETTPARYSYTNYSGAEGKEETTFYPHNGFDAGTSNATARLHTGGMARRAGRGVARRSD